MTTDSPLGSSSTNEYPSLLAANAYLVVGLVILVISSLRETSTLTKYGVAIAVEIALAVLAFLFMRMEHLRVVATARLRKPGLREVGLAILVLPGVWIAGVLLNLLSSLILGYSTPVEPSQYPRTLLDAVALAATTMVAAPLCEELIFRGYVQRAYERRNGWLGVTAGGLIFTLYHLRFQGAPALLPVAIALSFIAWRTESIVPGIALHAAYNTMATGLMIALSSLSLQTTGALTVTLVFLAAAATPVSVAALWLLWRGTYPPPRPQAVRPRPWQRWAALVPVIALIAIYGYAAATEVVVGAFPQLLSDGPIRLQGAAPEWEGSTSWRYGVRNSLGRDLGEATCTRTLDAQGVILECDADYRAYDLTSNIPAMGIDPDELPGALRAISDRLSTEALLWSLKAGWTRDTSQLTTLDITESAPNVDEVRLQYRTEGGRPSVSTSGTGEVSNLSQADAGSMLFPYEWAWRLSTMPLELTYTANATIVQLDETGQGQLHPALVNVVGGEPTQTPAGTVIAWKVVVTWEDASGRKQQQIAWYDSDSPHALISFNDGRVTYSLQMSETPSARTE